VTDEAQNRWLALYVLCAGMLMIFVLRSEPMPAMAPEPEHAQGGAGEPAYSSEAG
jgi:hypothetical protein